jgi:hypothetical protein
MHRGRACAREDIAEIKEQEPMSRQALSGLKCGRVHEQESTGMCRECGRSAQSCGRTHEQSRQTRIIARDCLVWLV